jgi:hypothetical protein
MKKFEKRDIETFEKHEYYIESWINGNKNHVKDELSELFYSCPLIAMTVISNLPKDIRMAVIDSQQMKDANLALTLKILRK